MLPSSFLLHCSIFFIGLESFSSGQHHQQRQQNQQRGDLNIPNLDNDIESTYSSVEHLIADSTRNGGRRSGGKKKNSDDDYHVVYESKPESYSNSYHHSDNYKEPTRTKTYGNSGGGGGGNGGNRRTTYGGNDNSYRQNNNGNRRSNKRNNEDYDDYDDSPQEGGRPVVEYDYDDSNGETRSGRGYDDNEKFSRSTKDDYHKTGELKDNNDFDDFGLDHGANFRRGKGSSGRNGRNKGRKNYSNSDDGEIGDSDYVDDISNEGYSNSNKKRSRDKEDNPLDRYEQRTRQALKEYGTLNGNAFLGSGQY